MLSSFFEIEKVVFITLNDLALTTKVVSYSIEHWIWTYPISKRNIKRAKNFYFSGVVTLIFLFHLECVIGSFQNCCSVPKHQTLISPIQPWSLRLNQYKHARLHFYLYEINNKIALDTRPPLFIRFSSGNFQITLNCSMNFKVRS